MDKDHEIVKNNPNYKALSIDLYNNEIEYTKHQQLKVRMKRNAESNKPLSEPCRKKRKTSDDHFSMSYDPNNKMMNESIFDPSKLAIINQISKGGCGRVLDAIYENFPVVIKCSLNEKKNNKIVREHKCLQLLQKRKFCGIPRIGHRFVHNGTECFLMNKLGTDLQKLVGESNENKFSLETTLIIALQTLERLRYVHSCGVVHNDIKPSNLLTGISDPNTIYLVDFGTATSYVADGKHIADEIKKVGGTPRYSSINCMCGRSPSRRDDLESLAYCLVKLRTGKLPWDSLVNQTGMDKKEQRKRIVECKRISAREICKDVRIEFLMFLREVRSLSFDEKPDYDMYYKMFEKLLNDQGFKADSPLIWNK